MTQVLDFTLVGDPLSAEGVIIPVGAMIFIPQYTDVYGRLWGIYTPAETPPNTLTVIPGNTVRFNAQFKYVGPAFSYSFYCSMGKQKLGFFDEDPQLTKSFSKTVPDTPTQATYTVSGDVPVPSTYTGYGWKDAYCKIVSPQCVSPIYLGAINIVQYSPTFSEMKITEFVKV